MVFPEYEIIQCCACGKEEVLDITNEVDRLIAQYCWQVIVWNDLNMSEIYCINCYKKLYIEKDGRWELRVEASDK